MQLFSYRKAAPALFQSGALLSLCRFQFLTSDSGLDTAGELVDAVQLVCNGRRDIGQGQGQIALQQYGGKRFAEITLQELLGSISRRRNLFLPAAQCIPQLADDSLAPRYGTVNVQDDGRAGMLQDYFGLVCIGFQQSLIQDDDTILGIAKQRERLLERVRDRRALPGASVNRQGAIVST